MWTNAPVVLGIGEHSRGSLKIFDAGFAFFEGLRRHRGFDALTTPQWFRLTLKVTMPVGS